MRLYEARASEGACVFTGAPPTPRRTLVDLAHELGLEAHERDQAAWADRREAADAG